MEQPAPPAAFNTCLRVNRIRLDVLLGYEEEERSQVQPVEVDIAFYFPLPTGASHNDTGDFVCYDKLSHALRSMCEGREFRLIEYLGMEMYHVARKAAPEEVKITLRLTKCKILVPFVLAGASFTYSDLPPFAWTPPL